MYLVNAPARGRSGCGFFALNRASNEAEAHSLNFLSLTTMNCVLPSFLPKKSTVENLLPCPTPPSEYTLAGGLTNIGSVRRLAKLSGTSASFRNPSSAISLIASLHAVSGSLLLIFIFPLFRFIAGLSRVARISAWRGAIPVPSPPGFKCLDILVSLFKKEKHAQSDLV